MKSSPFLMLIATQVTVKPIVHTVHNVLRPRRLWMVGSWLSSNCNAPKMMMKCCSVMPPAVSYNL